MNWHRPSEDRLVTNFPVSLVTPNPQAGLPTYRQDSHSQRQRQGSLCFPDHGEDPYRFYSQLGSLSALNFPAAVFPVFTHSQWHYISEVLYLQITALQCLMHLFPLISLLLFQTGLIKEESQMWAQLAIRRWKPTSYLIWQIQTQCVCVKQNQTNSNILALGNYIMLPEGFHVYKVRISLDAL